MGREMVVTPSVWSPRGEAEAVVRGRRMKVWQGIVGESARVRVVAEGQNADFAIFRETTTPARERVEPRCDRYHTCGGCPWMHMDARGQADARTQLVRDALDAEGLRDVPIDGFVDSPDGQDGFRWVVKLGIGYSDRGRLRIGAWGRRTRSIVPIPHCHVASDPIRHAMTLIAHHVLDLDIRPYDPITDEGVLRAIVIRGSRTTGDILVTLVAGRRIRALHELAERLMREPSQIQGIALHLNDDEGNAIFRYDEEEDRVLYKLLEGRPWIEETLNGVTYRIGPGDFFQTNPGLAERLYADVVERLELEPEVPVVDLYCGVGGFALQAARHTGWALGIEEGAGAIDAAREAAKANGLTAEFLSGRVDELMPQVARRLAASRPVVIVNPARRGLEEGVIDGITTVRPRRIAYISCNPRALARDLAAFREQGMQATSVVLYDMFPNTAHVECVAVLEGASADDARRAPRRKVVGRARSGGDA